MDIFHMKMFPHLGLSMWVPPRVEDDARQIRVIWSDLIYNVCLTFITCVGTQGVRSREREQERGVVALGKRGRMWGWGDKVIRNKGSCLHFKPKGFSFLLLFSWAFSKNKIKQSTKPFKQKRKTSSWLPVPLSFLFFHLVGLHHCHSTLFVLSGDLNYWV